VVVGGEEGYVRKISVRSTEVETRGPRVLIPNRIHQPKGEALTLRDNTRRIVIRLACLRAVIRCKVQGDFVQSRADNPAS